MVHRHLGNLGLHLAMVFMVLQLALGGGVVFNLFWQQVCAFMLVCIDDACACKAPVWLQQCQGCQHVSSRLAHMDSMSEYCVKES